MVGPSGIVLITLLLFQYFLLDRSSFAFRGVIRGGPGSNSGGDTLNVVLFKPDCNPLAHTYVKILCGNICILNPHLNSMLCIPQDAKLTIIFKKFYIWIQDLVSI